MLLEPLDPRRRCAGVRTLALLAHEPTSSTLRPSGASARSSAPRGDARLSRSPSTGTALLAARRARARRRDARARARRLRPSGTGGSRRSHARTTNLGDRRCVLPRRTRWPTPHLEAGLGLLRASTTRTCGRSILGLKVRSELTRVALAEASGSRAGSLGDPRDSPRRGSRGCSCWRRPGARGDPGVGEAIEQAAAIAPPPRARLGRAAARRARRGGLAGRRRGAIGELTAGPALARAAHVPWMLGELAVLAAAGGDATRIATRSPSRGRSSSTAAGGRRGRLAPAGLPVRGGRRPGVGCDGLGMRTAAAGAGRRRRRGASSRGVCAARRARASPAGRGRARARTRPSLTGRELEVLPWSPTGSATREIALRFTCRPGRSTTTCRTSCASWRCRPARRASIGRRGRHRPDSERP